jgi:acyl dehydratase
MISPFYWGFFCGGLIVSSLLVLAVGMGVLLKRGVRRLDQREAMVARHGGHDTN